MTEWQFPVRLHPFIAADANTAERPISIDPKIAFIVRDMMREVVDRGTATSVRRYLPASIPVAGKTGTTNDNTDVWFVGMTPEVVAGVWLGFDRPKTITPGAAGGTLAAPIFGKMMAEYYASRSAAEWHPPAGLIAAQVDRVTGQLADSPHGPIARSRQSAQRHASRVCAGSV